ncbi:MAG: hypothetical protein DRN42_03265 [Thermoplasmata archaeon]|nr:MAG: hypothetical protein DRN42_03265 [Thermoplasmata archaeon]
MFFYIRVSREPLPPPLSHACEVTLIKRTRGGCLLKRPLEAAHPLPGGPGGRKFNIPPNTYTIRKGRNEIH